MKMTKTKCPFCRLPMEFGMGVDGHVVVWHQSPECAAVRDHTPREFLIAATAKTTHDTQRLIDSRGGN
jgi:hypothetical protein